MAFITQIRKDIDFYQGLSSLLKVLKGVAIAQYHVFERKVQIFEKFSETVDGFLAGIDFTGIHHPLLTPESEYLGVVAVTSDVGLLGGLNMHVMNATFKELEQYRAKLIVVGGRGAMYAREKGIACTSLRGITEEHMFTQAIELRNHIVLEMSKGSIGGVEIIYPHADSLIVQRVLKIPLLPFGAQKDQEKNYLNLNDFILETSVERIVEYLVFLWLGKRIYEVFTISKLAEFAARFTHLEDCGRTLEEKDKKLRSRYHRLRHEITDRGMRELFAARLMKRHS